MSTVMNDSTVDQEAFYRRHWLEPIESQFSIFTKEGIDLFNEILSEFTKLKGIHLKHTSAAEKSYLQFCNGSTQLSAAGRIYIQTYAKLCSQLEEMASKIKEGGQEIPMRTACVLYMEELARFSRQRILKK